MQHCIGAVEIEKFKLPLLFSHMPLAHETSIFNISDASPIDCTPYHGWEPRIKGRRIFRYTVGFPLISALAAGIVMF